LSLKKQQIDKNNRLLNKIEKMRIEEGMKKEEEMMKGKRKSKRDKLKP